MINTLEQSENLLNFQYSPNFLPVSRTVYALCDNLDQKISTANFIVSLFKRIEELEEENEILKNNCNQILKMKDLKETKDEIVDTDEDKIVLKKTTNLKEHELFEIRVSCNEYYKVCNYCNNNDSINMWNQYCEAGNVNYDTLNVIKACACAFKKQKKKEDNNDNVPIFDTIIEYNKACIDIDQIKNFSNSTKGTNDTNQIKKVIRELNSLKCLLQIYLGDNYTICTNIITPDDYNTNFIHIGYSNKDMIANKSITEYQESTDYDWDDYDWIKDMLEINDETVSRFINNPYKSVDLEKFKQAVKVYKQLYQQKKK